MHSEPSIGGSRRDVRGAFTLVELLVATTVFALIMALMIVFVGHSTALWQRSSQTIDAFQSARLGFDLITRDLSQATLNTYLNYDDPLAPKRYLRKSELRLVIGAAGDADFPGTRHCGQAVFFQAPVNYTVDYPGLDTLLNTCGYYVEFASGKDVPPHVSGAANPFRYRLMQLLVPAEKKNIYDATMQANNLWFTTYAQTAAGQPSYTHAVAENVIALILRPQDPASDPADFTTDYTDDTALKANDNPQPITAQQLPPVVQLTMIALDEAAAKRIDKGNSPPSLIADALSTKFLKTADYQTDLNLLESQLVAAHIQYRVFSSAVPLRESKWTK